MKVKFKVPRALGEVTYQPGIHEVPDEYAKHWYLLAQIQNGNASIVEAPGAKKAEKVVVQPKAKVDEPEEAKAPAKARGSKKADAAKGEAEAAQ